MSFGGGSGGSSSIAGSTDVFLSSPQDDQVLSYSTGTAKWVNATAPAALVTSVAGKTGEVTLAKADVGLANVDNTSDASKPVSMATQAALSAKADAAVTITGTDSLTGGGTLAANRTVSLVGDAASPGANKYYGTNASGVKGYHDLAGGGGTLSLPGVVQLDDFPGANDDAKLTTALSYAASQARIPWIQFPARNVTLNQGGRVPFTGMKLVGPGGFGGSMNPEVNFGGGHPNTSHRVTLGSGIGTGTSALFNGAAAGELNAITVSNLCFVCPGRNAQFWHGPYASGANLYSCQFDNLSFMAMRHVFGTATQSVACTGVRFSGFWVVNSFMDQTGSQNPTQFHLTGSDNELWTGGWINIEGSNPGSNSGSWMMILNNLGKTNVGGVYATARYGWRGILVSGNADGLTFYGARAEGRNAGSACHGSVMRIEGGAVTLRDAWIAYGMGDPSSFGGGNNGMIQVTGGQVLLDGLRYSRATGVAETVPLVYATGGVVEARTVHKRGTWSGNPRIQATGGATVYADTNYWTVA